MIDFYALIRDEFGPERQPLKLDEESYRKLTEQFEAAHMRYLMERYGNKKRVARILGINRQTVLRKCKLYGIGAQKVVTPVQANQEDSDLCLTDLGEISVLGAAYIDTVTACRMLGVDGPTLSHRARANKWRNWLNQDKRYYLKEDVEGSPRV